MENWRKSELEAVERLRALLAKPNPETRDDVGDVEFFEPWDLFPAIYGTYSGCFDKCAIEVLTELRDGKFERSDLAAYMFREMLCTQDLCDYGSSPRVCFPSRGFGELLPELIERWKQYSLLSWGEDVCIPANRQSH